MKGVTYEEYNPNLWQSLIHLQARVREYISVLGLELVLDEAEGYAYLRQRPADKDKDEQELPRLVPRRQLGYSVSLLLALLRKKLAEFDATSGETRLILAREQIADLMRLFLPDTTNEARILDRLDADIKKIEDMGFIRRLRGEEDRFEVRRIVKAFIDAQFLSQLEQRLAQYRAYISGQDVEEEGTLERS